jgi:hypothetical protein
VNVVDALKLSIAIVCQALSPTAGMAQNVRLISRSKKSPHAALIFCE